MIGTMSDLDVDDLAEPEPTDDRETTCGDDCCDTERFVEERLHVLGRDQEQEDARDRWQEAEDDP